MKKEIEIVVPVYNEEKAVLFFIDRLYKVISSLSQYSFKILFIDDGSKDSTLDIIKSYQMNDSKINYVSLSRNFGKEVAMIAGIDYSDGDAVIFIDADLQDPPELIPEMIKYWEEGYEDVYAQRKSRKGESFFKILTAKLYYRFLQSITSIEIQKDTGDYRLLDKKCIAALRNIRETSRNSKGIFSWIGFKKKAVLFDREPRIAGHSKWNYKKLFNLAIDGITSFTTSPLRVSIFIGIPILIIFVIYFIFFMINFSSFSEESILLRTIILLVLLFTGIQVMLFGIIGEYLGRIFNETKHRPLYFISEESISKINNEKGENDEQINKE